MKKEDGGAAFPRPCSDDRTDGDQPDGNVTLDGQEGMSLRDYFAAKAMQGEIVSNSSAEMSGSSDLDDRLIAEWAYRMADAMLAARKK